MKSKSEKSESKKSESGLKPYFKTLFFADLLALFLIILASILIYNTHTKLEGPVFDTKTLTTVNVSLGDYPYPLHFDEFNHISSAKQIMDEGLGAETNPQLYSSEKSPIYLERGFHILLALISLCTGASLIKLSLILPAVFFGLGALLIYLFFSRTLKKPLAGIFTVLFLIFVPSNANVLGFWFMTPLSLTLIFIGGLLLLLYEIRRPRNIIFGALLTFVSFFIYPIITVLLLLMLAVFTVIEYKGWNYFMSGKKWLLVAGAAVFALLLFFLRKKILFGPGWTDVITTQTVMTYVLPAVIVFAAAGFFWLFVENKFLFGVIFVYSLFGILSTALYFMFEYGFIVPYQRMLFLWGILLSVAAGYGVYFTILSFSVFAEKKIAGRMKLRKNIIPKAVLALKVFLALAITILVLAICLPSYYSVKTEEFAIQRIVHPEQAKLLSYINASSPKAVLADPYFSAAIYPLGKNKAVAALSGNLYGGKYAFVYNNFMRSENFCDTKWAMLREIKIDFIIINRKQNCEFLREIAADGDYYLYMVMPDLLPYSNYVLGRNK